MEYSRLAESITPSAIRKMMEQAARMEHVISLSVGEPDFITEPAVLEAARNSMEKSTKYAPGPGFDALRDKYTDYLNRTIGSCYERDQVVVTNGGMAALYLSLKALLNPGDEVLLCAPYFSNYEGMVRMNGGKPVNIEVREEDGFVLHPDILRKHITPRSKVLLLNSPCNPTGAVIREDTLREIAEIACKYDLFVISDEVYRHLIYDEEEIVSIAVMPGMRERCAVIDSVSKGFAMTGFRIGFVAGPRHFISLIIKLTENVYSSVSSVSQYAAMAALDQGENYRNYMVGEYQKRRNYLTERISHMNGISCIRPRGAFYVFANIKKTGLTADEFAERLLMEKRVAVVPGTNFSTNASGYIRISYGASMEHLEEGMNRLEDFLNNLNI